MTMIASLKTLLFSTAAGAVTDATATAQPKDGAPDFSALLSNVEANAASTSTQAVTPEHAPPFPASQQVPGVTGEASAPMSVSVSALPQVETGETPAPLAPNEPAGVTHRLKPGGHVLASSTADPSVAVAPVLSSQDDATDDAQPVDEEASPLSDSPTALVALLLAAQPMSTPVAAAAPLEGDAVPPRAETPVAAAPVLIGQPVSTPVAAAASLEGDAGLPRAETPVAAAPVLTAQPVSTPVATAAPVRGDAPPPRPEKPAATIVPTDRIGVAPVSAALDLSLPAGQALDVLNAPTQPVAVPSQTDAVVEAAALPPVAATPTRTTAVHAAMLKSDPADAMAVQTMAMPVASDPVRQTVASHAVPPRADAASLLQFVRDHMNMRVPPNAVEASARSVQEATASASTAPDAALSGVGSSTSAPLPAPVLAPSAATPPVAPTIAVSATPDLSTSIGAQVIDMGVQGQWIDGLAREIAGLSAHGAQGRFQIDTHQLGAVQVDIRQGADGAAVSLTVASQAAEDALRQDSDLLRIDAGLQAVRISEVKIERAPPLAEAARTETQNQQQGSQHSSHHQGQNQTLGQNGSQNPNQSAQQGRWQGRENFGQSHKAGAEMSVLNHADAGEDTRDGPRARYA